jgi:type I restriction enzyme, S subunit
MGTERKLSQIATITMGTSPKGDTYNESGIGLPLLNGPTEFGAIHPECSLFTTNSLRKGKTGDLIFCVRGSTTGRMNWADRIYSLGRGVCSIRGESILDTRFIKYCIDWKLEELLNLAGGGTFPNLTQDTIRNFLIPYPEHRSKIASILSTFDDLIENNLRRIKILEEMAQNLYREWFVKFRFPGHENARFVDSPLGRIPEGWDVKPLDGLIESHIGGGWGKLEKEVKYPEPAWVIRGTDIPQARFCSLSNVPFRYHTISNLRSRVLIPGDIIFEVSGGSKDQPLGRTLLVSSELLSALGGQPVICASFCKKIRPKSKVYAPVIFYLSFLDAYENGEIEQYQVQSTGISNFKWTAYIESVIRCVPSIEIQNSFKEIVSPMFSEIGVLGHKNTILRQTRDLLLPKLISGEVNVTDLDIKIPETIEV